MSYKLRPLKHWDIPVHYSYTKGPFFLLYPHMRTEVKCPLEGDCIYPCTLRLCVFLCLYRCKFNDSSKIEVRRRLAFTFVSLLCSALNGKQLAAQTPWPTRIISPRHEITAGPEPIARCALNCQDLRRRDETLRSNPRLTYTLSISNESLTGIDGAVMDGEKPC